MRNESAQLSETTRIYIWFFYSVGIMVAIFGLGYYALQHWLGTPRPLVECFYFVWLTIVTVGYGDDGFSGGVLIRWVTIFGGSYLVVRFVVLSAHVYARTVVDEVYNVNVMAEMRQSLSKATGHFLVFGDDLELMSSIISGLVDRQQVYLVSDSSELIDELKEEFPTLKYVKAKPCKDETIALLRPETAAGAYLLHCDDAKSVLLAAALQGRVRVISSYSGNREAMPRFERVGVRPISPYSMGGLKMVSTMIRPKATAFLDQYVLPGDAPLEFRIHRPGDRERAGPCVALAAVVDDNIDFNSAPAEHGAALVIGFGNAAAADTDLGPLTGPSLPAQTDRFLVIGSGTMADTVTTELARTRRKVVRRAADEDIETLREQYAGSAIEFVSDLTADLPYDIDAFDGVAVCGAQDDTNFAAALDFADSRALRVVRGMDDDMEAHYRRIDAIPVFAGRVGARNMLREVTNQFANQVLRAMVLQSHRLSQVLIAEPCAVADIEDRFGVRAVAFCRSDTCSFAPGADTQLAGGDALIVCGHVDANRDLRAEHARVASD